MRKITIKYVVALIGIVCFTGCFLFREKFSWDEIVSLSDGKSILIHRTVFIGSDQWGRSGRGRIESQSIEFDYKGKQIHWSLEDGGKFSILPEIVDIVNGQPIIILPIDDRAACEKFGYPKSGYVAMYFDGHRWHSAQNETFSKYLKVNLLRHVNSIRNKGENGLTTISPSEKMIIEGVGWGASKQGDSLIEASRRYRDSETSCANLQLSQNPVVRNAMSKNVASEAAAEIHRIKALQFVEMDSNEQRKLLLEKRSGSTKQAYLRPSCDGHIQTVSNVRDWNRPDLLSGILIGIQIRLKNPKSQDSFFVGNSIKSQIDSILCGKSIIVLVKRDSAHRIIIDKYTQNGLFLNSYVFWLEDASTILKENSWGELLKLELKDDQHLAITLADYTDSQFEKTNRMYEATDVSKVPSGVQNRTEEQAKSTVIMRKQADYVLDLYGG